MGIVLCSYGGCYILMVQYVMRMYASLHACLVLYNL
jgi:hypothetical protein